MLLLMIVVTLVVAFELSQQLVVGRIARVGGQIARVARVRPSDQSGPRQLRDRRMFRVTVFLLPTSIVLFVGVMLWLIDSPYAAWTLWVWVLVFLASLGLGGLASRHKSFASRQNAERAIIILLATCAALALLITIGVFVTLLGQSFAFFALVSPIDFIFGLKWSPQTALFADEVGSSGAFGIVPVLGGTLLISAIAMVIAVPVGLFVAIYLSFYASMRFRRWGKPTIEILAGIPTIVYGLFAAVILAPIFRDAGTALGIGITGESAIVAGLVMGVMIIPFVSSLSDDVFRSVPKGLAEGSYGLGATKSEVIRTVVMPAAVSGLFGGFLLALSRAIGETMIVVMAAGLAANLTANPFAAVTTVTVQIVTLLVGDHSFDSAKTLSAFALALSLFLITLMINLIALVMATRARRAL
ncbi:MAG: phosphate ABC transporter permease subunit PstC [Alphaproteobacteria bacterium]|nr:phosphate ABC transporter permease subunit PstC [Alphaproteobacteria bacterium]